MPLEDLLLFPTRVEADAVLGACRTRTPISRDEEGEASRRAAICGVGLAIAGLRTAALLERHRPRRLILLGIGGSYDLERAPIGSVRRGDRCAVHGIGAGEGVAHLPLDRMGIELLPGLASDVLDPRAPGAEGLPGAGIVSVTAASADLEAAARARARLDGALIEDMESWSVALAARLSSTPLLILRAVSNRAGIRDRGEWRIGAALAALAGPLEVALS